MKCNLFVELISENGTVEVTPQLDKQMKADLRFKERSARSSNSVPAVITSNHCLNAANAPTHVVPPESSIRSLPY